MLDEERKIRRRRMVAAVLQQQISTILLTEVKDPGCAGAVITEVKVSRDLSSAVATVRAREGQLDVTERTVHALNRAAPFIRRQLRGRIELRRIPTVKFVEDRGLVASVRIAEMLKGLELDATETEEECKDLQ